MMLHLQYGATTHMEGYLNVPSCQSLMQHVDVRQLPLEPHNADGLKQTADRAQSCLKRLPAKNLPANS